MQVILAAFISALVLISCTSSDLPPVAPPPTPLKCSIHSSDPNFEKAFDVTFDSIDLQVRHCIVCEHDFLEHRLEPGPGTIGTVTFFYDVRNDTSVVRMEMLKAKIEEACDSTNPWKEVDRFAKTKATPEVRFHYDRLTKHVSKE